MSEPLNDGITTWPPGAKEENKMDAQGKTDPFDRHSWSGRVLSGGGVFDAGSAKELRVGFYTNCNADETEPDGRLTVVIDSVADVSVTREEGRKAVAVSVEGSASTEALARGLEFLAQNVRDALRALR